MTTTMPTRQQIDRAEPLDFTPRTKAEPATVTAHVVIGGVSMDVTFTAHVEQLPAVAARLVALGATPVQPTTAAAPVRKAGEKVSPEWNGAGEAMCPVHKRILKQGKWGMYCSAKGEDETYCNLKFDA